ncbi:Gfo/Idh/MocA family protein [Mesorhizobium ventifaucium]|uniref:Gfo/Idh/MocA family protein n=1 Tax=Mesorhizobium ventifaucium TaxID=666020 RepID=UPI0020A732E4|nr:Gfo/Idh/MocA family oxidoreductase [Mesorhizobium ventifaucium]
MVGAGWIAQEAFMPSVSQTGNSTISAIVSGSAKNAAKLAEFHGVEHVFSYERYDQMLASDVADAVYVALPNSMHADYAIRALRAGKHALVEKPLATTEAECEAMIAAANESGAHLMTAYRLHNEPGTVELLERIRSGEIGDPRIFSAVFSFVASPDNHRLKAGYWGGPLQDIGVYCLNAARHIFATEPIEAVAVKSFGNGSAVVGEVEESIAVTLRFPQGRLAQFIASFGADNSDFYHVGGTKGSVTADPGFRFETAVRMKFRQGDTSAEKTFPQTDHFAGQTAYFSDCILGAQPPEPDGEEGLADVRALLAIERAASTGQPQKIDTPARQFHPTAEMIRILPTTEKRLVL